ncbi:MAG: N-acetylornithine carbamoyltransferase [Gammaproteobacteria bacterium]|nr:N-acetylornithine carbamoyltransferase [Gammaproteobacteria bacterium]
MNFFNDLADFSAAEIRELIALARRLDENPEPQALEGKVLSLLFLSPSLRTLISFQSAMARMGGATFVISPEMSIHGIESRSGIVMDGIAAEHIREAVPVIASYGDAIGIRAFAKRENLDDDLADREFSELISLIDTPYINMESAINHPCQSLADWKTMDDLGIPANGGKLVLSWTWHPQPMPYAVPAATVHMAALRGMDVMVLRPEGYELPDTIMDKARHAAAISGGSVMESNDRTSAMQGAQVLYVNSWASARFYGDRRAEDKIKPELQDWCVDEPWFENAASDCRFMHCLPIRRGVTATDCILDGPRSVVIAEAHNRMMVQMALLHQMLSNP